MEIEKGNRIGNELENFIEVHGDRINAIHKMRMNNFISLVRMEGITEQDIDESWKGITALQKTYTVEAGFDNPKFPSAKGTNGVSKNPYVTSVMNAVESAIVSALTEVSQTYSIVESALTRTKQKQTSTLTIQEMGKRIARNYESRMEELLDGEHPLLSLTLDKDGNAQYDDNGHLVFEVVSEEATQEA